MGHEVVWKCIDHCAVCGLLLYDVPWEKPYCTVYTNSHRVGKRQSSWIAELWIACAGLWGKSVCQATSLWIACAGLWIAIKIPLKYTRLNIISNDLPNILYSVGYKWITKLNSYYHIFIKQYFFNNKLMCRKTTCSSCGKSSWAGCGQHIESALNGVAESDRCPGWRTGICIKPKAASGSVAKSDDKCSSSWD